MAKLNQRLDRIERLFGNELDVRRCPLCLNGGVVRMRINGQKQLGKDDAVYDQVWHCRRCGAAAREINIVTPMGLAGTTHGQPEAAD